MNDQQHRRSAIPKVTGILMIIFASLGLLSSLRGLVVSSVDPELLGLVPQLKTWRSIELLFGVLGCGVGVLHLLAGVRAVGYRTVAPKLAVAYATIAMVVTLIHSTIIYAWLRPLVADGMTEVFGRSSLPANMLGPLMIIGGLLSLTWPIIAMSLMTRPSARAACDAVAAGPVRLGLSG